MLVVIDIGNTNITFGFVRGRQKYSVYNFPTRLIKKQPFFKKELCRFMRVKRINPLCIQSAVICSVVPKAESVLERNLKKIFASVKSSFLGRDITIPIRNCYKKPHQVGNDRLVNALGVKANYRLPALVVDFGTATTIDVISRDGAYQGGIIVPGIRMSLESLHEKTALLPLLTAGKPHAILGRDTKNSILSGVFYGYSFLVDGFINALAGNTLSSKTVIATGGNLKIMKSLCRKIDIFDPYLTLKGIEMAFKNKKIKENKSK